MALSDDDIVVILRQELSRAVGWESDELSGNRKKAFEYFYNEPRGDEIAGRSSIQSSDVSDMVEAVMSNINPILTNETLIQFEAAGEDDEESATLESEFTAYMIGGQNAGYLELTSAVKDSLMLRNGFIKVWVDETKRTEKFSEQDLQEFQIQAILDESDLEQTITIDSITDASEREKGLAGFDVRFSRFIHKRELMVASIAPENIMTSPESDRQLISEHRFVAERKLLTQTELLEMGYPQEAVMDLPSYDAETRVDSSARRQDSDNTLTAADTSQRLIETYDIHTMIDVKENGMGSLWHFHLASSELLMKEQAEWIPIATGSPFIVAHRLYGQSIYDKLRTIQDSKTHFLRQWHDNARVVNNARLVYNPKETQESDVMTSRPGGGIRSKNPQNVVPLQVSDMGPSILGALEYMDKIRSERGGASLDLNSAELQLAGGNIGEGGAERQISVKEGLAAMMTATLANTLIRETFILTHKTLRAHMPGELTAKVNGKWVQTDPSQWPERRKVNVMTGMSKGEKMQRLAALNQVITTQVSFLSQGQEGELVAKANIHNAIMDWARAANLENPDQYWIDPTSEEAQAAAKGKAEAAQAQQQAQQQAVQQQVEMQQQIFAMSAQLDKYKHDTDLMYKWASDRLQSEIDEAKIVGAATLELEKQQQIFDDRAAVSNEAANAA